ncbi:hypothetical protein CEXT_626831 [Caerostris extrusa]|uniref:Uncharacterized protein n=1 Tax=Caerostris extrusa TaxID=172846 RepID=A0AAV4MJK9_CAEEX|nr:hypothetical protein CEXT_626831 [Caerostris extrusa]
MLLTTHTTLTAFLAEAVLCTVFFLSFELLASQSALSTMQHKNGIHFLLPFCAAMFSGSYWPGMLGAGCCDIFIFIDVNVVNQVEQPRKEEKVSSSIR